MPVLRCEFAQSCPYVHGDVICLVAFDFILRLFTAGVMRVTFPIDIARVNPDDVSANAAGFRIPGHMIADLETFAHQVFGGAGFKMIALAGSVFARSDLLQAAIRSLSPFDRARQRLACAIASPGSSAMARL